MINPSVINGRNTTHNRGSSYVTPTTYEISMIATVMIDSRQPKFRR
jgi:hypothetical protein